MAHKVTRCETKDGRVYYVRQKRDWGKPSYSVDPQFTGWHSTAKAARVAAEQAGYVWVNNMLVHKSAAQYYRDHS